MMSNTKPKQQILVKQVSLPAIQEYVFFVIEGSSSLTRQLVETDFLILKGILNWKVLFIFHITCLVLLYGKKRLYKRIYNFKTHCYQLVLKKNWSREVANTSSAKQTFFCKLCYLFIKNPRKIANSLFIRDGICRAPKISVCGSRFF